MGVAMIGSDEGGGVEEDIYKENASWLNLVGSHVKYPSHPYQLR